MYINNIPVDKLNMCFVKNVIERKNTFVKTFVAIKV